MEGKIFLINYLRYLLFLIKICILGQNISTFLGFWIIYEMEKGRNISLSKVPGNNSHMMVISGIKFIMFKWSSMFSWYQVYFVQYFFGLSHISIIWKFICGIGTNRVFFSSFLNTSSRLWKIKIGNQSHTPQTTKYII
jgi:hypothetical protein